MTKKKHLEVPGVEAMQQAAAAQVNRFVAYVLDFYGPDSELYPMGATEDQVRVALDQLIADGHEVAFDSVDREKVRDIMIEKFGLVFPPAKQ